MDLSVWWTVICSLYGISWDGIEALTKPYFISTWVFMDAQVDSKSVATIDHNLGEYPAKVDVQVKVVDAGKEYIFTGFGSGHRDDDVPYVYGGVIYVYNDVSVRLMAPNKHDGETLGKCAYTGGTSINGPGTLSGMYKDCHVRVRLWRSQDLGDPSFDQSGIIMDTTTNTFKEVIHNLNKYPDVISVQLLLDGGYISDAQGNAFSGLKRGVGVGNMGGLVYGYDNTRVRLWTPLSSDSRIGVFSDADGWGDIFLSIEKSGSVRIRMWSYPSSISIFSKTLTSFGVGVPNNTYRIPFTNTIDLENSLVLVEVTVQTPDNLTLTFLGAGSFIANGRSNILTPFGGVVYVYNAEEVQLYVSEPGWEGHLVYVGDIWGGGQHAMAIDSGSVTVKVIASTKEPTRIQARPYFISNWVYMDAQVDSKSVATIDHNLGEYPAKVDVQVKVVDAGKEYIFTGFGSGHRDDDVPYVYGGVIYVYNDVSVRLMAPNKHDGETLGKCAYTGGTSINGPGTLGGMYKDCHVRVRLWRSKDLGDPSFDQSGIIMDTTTNAFKEVFHNLNEYPDVISVQVLIDGGYVSDAQGNVFSGLKRGVGVGNMGGLVYGYDRTRVRLWTPLSSDSRIGVFSDADGWGDIFLSIKKNGTVRIRMWSYPSSISIFTKTLTSFGVGVPNNTYRIPFANHIDLEKSLIIVEVTVQTNDNLSLRFIGAGSFIANGRSNILTPFGGVVYVYNAEEVQLYVSEPGWEGHLVYVGDIWGGGQHAMAIDSGSVTVKVIDSPREALKFKRAATDLFKSGDELFAHNTRSVTECSTKCIGNKFCASFFYQASSRSCAGHSDVYNSNDLHFHKGYKYYTLLNSVF